MPSLNLDLDVMLWMILHKCSPLFFLSLMDISMMNESKIKTENRKGKKTGVIKLVEDLC